MTDAKIGEQPQERGSLAVAISQRKNTTSSSNVDDDDNDHEKKNEEPQPQQTFLMLSEVESLAARIEERRANRILVTFNVRVRFLKTCRKIADENGLDVKIPVAALQKFRDNVAAEVKTMEERNDIFMQLRTLLGFRNESETLLRVLDRALIRVEELESEYLYFQDFNFYFTRLESKWPWMRRPFTVTVMILLGFYLLTVIFFCAIVSDDNICPSHDYEGWLTALYFASTTMSTVGYGDVSVDKSSSGRIFVGILYMLLSNLVLVTAFASAVEQASSPLLSLQQRLIDLWVHGYSAADIERKEKAAEAAIDKALLQETQGGGAGKLDRRVALQKRASILRATELKQQQKSKAFLYQRLRRITIIRLASILVQALFLNIVGVLVARIVINANDNDVDVPESQQWSWMTTLYWSVQTTTTIGYGDLDMPFGLRWFQVLYLMVSTYYVGSAIGRLGSLKTELEDVRANYAWQRRKVSKGLIQDMRAAKDDAAEVADILKTCATEDSHHTNTSLRSATSNFATSKVVTDYEFVVASLLTLNKITAADITLIMDKFRTLTGNANKRFISFENEDAVVRMEEAENTNMDCDRNEDGVIDEDELEEQMMDEAAATFDD